MKLAIIIVLTLIFGVTAFDIISDLSLFGRSKRTSVVIIVGILEIALMLGAIILSVKLAIDWDMLDRALLVIRITFAVAIVAGLVVRVVRYVRKKQGK